jgi:hypothetical protein
MVVVVPLCLAAAWVLDKLVGLFARRLAPGRDDDRSDTPS